MPTSDVTILTARTHTVEYTVTDSNGDETTEARIIIVENTVELLESALGDVTLEVKYHKQGLLSVAMGLYY